MNNNIQLIGISTTSGGKYHDVVIEGVAKVRDSIECGYMKVDGVVSVKGDLTCSEMVLKGSGTIDGNVSGLQYNIEGLLTIHGNVEAESFQVDGSFKLDGSLNADSVNIHFVYGANAKEVYGEKINIRKYPNESLTFIMDLIPWRHKGNTFSCNCIEGDDVYLEGVEADVVRGQNINIGYGSHIKLVEYHDQIFVDPNAKVDELRKIGESQQEQFMESDFMKA